MRKFFAISLTLLITSNAAKAQENNNPVPRDKWCIFIANTYNNAIATRNRGLGPEYALAAADFKDIPLEIRKKIINEVYFDEKLKSAVSSSDLVFEIMQVCLHGRPKPFEPLR